MYIYTEKERDTERERESSVYIYIYIHIIYIYTYLHGYIYKDLEKHLSICIYIYRERVEIYKHIINLNINIYSVDSHRLPSPVFGPPNVRCSVGWPPPQPPANSAAVHGPRPSRSTPCDAATGRRMGNPELKLGWYNFWCITVSP